MAKDIKAIKCPHCGSIYKIELKPDFYRCNNCQTEYFLDSDDLHIYHHRQQVPPVQSSAPAGNSKTPVYILLFTIACIGIAYVLVMFFNRGKTTHTNSSNYVTKTLRMKFADYLYTNSETGDPVYLSMGTEAINQGNDQQQYEVHAKYNNASNGSLLADRVMFNDKQQHDIYGVVFRTCPGNLVYAVFGKTALLQLDTKTNKFTDVTRSLFNNFPQLSSGIARIEFAYEKDVINLMSNEGKAYYYFPVSRQLVDDAGQMEKIWKKGLTKSYFTFGYLGDYFDKEKPTQLIKEEYFQQEAQFHGRDLTPGRKYFDSDIVYQDEANLLIATRTTAADAAPVSLQSIDVNTGKVKWAFPPGRYTFRNACKCKQGFAIQYSDDASLDYIHGAFVISTDGQLVNNYKLGRTE